MLVGKYRGLANLNHIYCPNNSQEVTMPCKKNKEYERFNRFEWRKEKDWKFPFKGHTLSNPDYIKAKNELFSLNGNGWWINDGKGWEMKPETIKEYNRRLRNKKEV